jgi:hypothetical protein
LPSRPHVWGQLGVQTLVTEIVDGDSTAEGTGTTPEGVAAAPQSVEEAEAIWQKRMSGKDKAHAAEVNELRRKLDEREAARQAASIASETPEQQRIRELEERLAVAEQARAVEARKARFPRAADDLGDDIAHVDEARLARLEARLAAEEDGPAPRIDRNAAPKGSQSAPAKTLDQMSRDELLDVLKTQAPAYREYLDSIR